MQLGRTLSSSFGGVWGGDPAGSDADIAVVRVADFDYERLVVQEAPTQRAIHPRLTSSRLLREGDLLLEKSGGGRKQNVGRVVEWTDGKRAICSNFVHVLRPASEVSARWLTYMHRSLYLAGYAAACTKQTTGIQNLDIAAYLSARIAVPERGIQAAVADFLDGESERISLVAERLEKLAAGAEEPLLAELDGYVDGWPHGRLGYRFDVQLGKMLDEKRVDPDQLVPYLRNANVHWDRILLDDVKEMSFDPVERRKFQLSPGDLLVCEGGEPGRAAVWDGSLGECYYQKALHRVRPRGEDSTRFLLWCLRLLVSRRAFGADGPGITHLTAEDLRAIQIPLPPPTVQVETVANLDARAGPARSLHEHCRLTQERLIEYRDALITEAVTGRLDVTRLSESRLDESAHAAIEGERPEVLSR